MDKVGISDIEMKYKEEEEEGGKKRYLYEMY